jgi:hypothetical protein
MQILTAEYSTNYFIRAGSNIGPVSKYGWFKSDLKLIMAHAVFRWYTVCLLIYLQSVKDIDPCDPDNDHM